MKPKLDLKQKAIDLRKKGYTYKEILNEVKVSKSSLSLWLRDMPLTTQEKKFLSSRKDARIHKGRIRAATTLRRRRIEREKEYVKEARIEFQTLKSKSLFFVGIALYWAEGTKRGDSCSFTNSDIKMIQVFLTWLETFWGFKVASLGYRLYIHKHYAHEDCNRYWAYHLNIPVKNIKISYKPDNKHVKKRPNYKGCIRVRVPKSSKLLFKLKIWHNMLAKEYSDIMRP